jgi:hypothetical protein
MCRRLNRSLAELRGTEMREGIFVLAVVIAAAILLISFGATPYMERTAQ